MRRQSSRTLPAQRSAATAWRFVASSPGYRVPTANRVKYFSPRFNERTIG